MDFGTIIKLVILFLASVLSVVMIVFCLLRGGKTPLLYSFIITQVLLIICFLGQALRMFSTNYRMESYFVRFQYLSMCFMSFAWLIFCLLYTESKFLKKRRHILMLSIIPAVSYLALLTNDWHHLFYRIHDQNFTMYNVLFYLHLFGVYLYAAIGALHLVKYSFRQFEYKKKQIMMLLVAMIIPISINILWINDLLMIGSDCVPFCLIISLVLSFIATFKYKLLNLLPIAQRLIVENMREAVMVIDSFNSIIDYNNSFAEIFPEIVETNDPNLGLFLEELCVRAEDTAGKEKLVQSLKNHNSADASFEIKIIDPVPQWLNVNIQSIKKGSTLLARVVSINDISSARQLAEELNSKNNELLAMNDRLKRYVATVEELSIAKERNRLAREMHDTLGQTMTLLITLLQVGVLNCRKDPTETENKLLEAIKIAEGGLAEVRRSLAGLSTVRLNSGNLSNSLHSLLSSYETIGLNGKLTMEEFEGDLPVEVANTIYRLCQEALTNSVRHGRARTVDIQIKQTEGKIEITIEDDGCGCDRIIKGSGLAGMEERVKTFAGMLHISSNKEGGFRIQAVIPVSE